MIPQFVKGIRIGARQIEVWEVPTLADEDGRALYGCYDAERGLILISQQGSEEERRDTFVHEIFHAISEAYGLDLSETAVRCLESGLVNGLWGPAYMSRIESIEHPHISHGKLSRRGAPRRGCK